jgi:hypothetical protein
MVYFSYSERLELFSGEGRGGREGGKRGGGLCGKRSDFLPCSVSCPGEDLFTLIKTSSANRVLLIWFEEARETIQKTKTDGRQSLKNVCFSDLYNEMF